MSARKSTRDDVDTAAPRGKLGRRLLFLCALLLLVVALLPTLVAKTPLGGWLLNFATADLNGRITFGDARFGWFGTQAVHHITVYDEQADVVARAGSIELENGLMALLFNSANVGNVRIEQPDVHLVVTEESTNIQQLLANMLTPDDDEEEEEPDDTHSSLSVTVQIADGRIEVVDTVRGQRWLLDQLGTECVIGGETPGALNIKLAARVTSDEGAAVLKLTATQTPDGASPDAVRGNVRVQAERLPLALLAAALGQTVPGIELSGTAATDLACAWSYSADGPLSLSTEGQVTADGATLAGPWFADGERLSLGRVTAPCRFTLDDAGVRVAQLGVDCGELGRLDVSGAMTRAGGVWQSDANRPLEGTAHVDLARLANMMPRTAGLYDGMSLTSGNVELRAAGSQDTQGTVINASLTTGDIVAQTPSGQSVSWRQPVTISLAARQKGASATETAGAITQGVIFEKIECRSDFAQINAAGTPSSMTADAGLDLALLAEHLRQFIDLGDTQLAGRAGAHLEWQLGDDEATATVQAEVNDLHLALLGGSPLVEPNLTINASLSGKAQDNTLRRVDTASLTFAAQQDKLSVGLSEAIDVAAGRWPVTISAAGDVSRWLARARPWLGPDVAANLTGAVALAANAEYTPAGLTIPAAQARLTNVKGELFGTVLDEPSAQLDLAATWNGEANSLELRNVVLRSSSVGLSSERLTLAGTSLATFKGEGKVLFAAELARLSPEAAPPTVATTNNNPGPPAPFEQPAHPLAAAPPPPGTKAATGRVDGSLTLTPTGGGTSLVTDATVKNLVVTSASGSTWQEPQVTARSTVRFDTADDAVIIDTLGITAQAITATASGRIDRPDEDCFVNVNGKLDYDWDKLSAALAAYMPEQVKLVGHESRSFTLKGPLSEGGAIVSTDSATGNTVQPPPDATGSSALARLSADTTVGWREAMIYGFRLGQADLPLTLEGGILRLANSQIDVNGGRVNLGGDLRVTPGPLEARVPTGRIVDQVEITPEMCAEGLMYVSPIFAGVSTASGKFSVDIEKLRLPLEALDQGDLAGAVTVHTVELGPGPLIRELGVLFTRGGPIRLKEESVVPFQMYQGRIYHRDMVLQFGDFEIHTSGSVGLDRTLSLTAQMPIPDKWIGNNRLGEFLKNRTIEVPIGGTLDHPQLDHRRLDELSASLFRESATNALQGELGRQLDRFLTPRR